MNKYKEALNILHRYANRSLIREESCEYTRQKIDEYYYILNVLVEKSIPKKPRVIKVYEDVVCYECPNCNSRTPTNFRKNYCDVCGQKLDWSEEND